VTANNKIGILTGGGDVPGLNSVIKSVVYGASETGRAVTGIRKGWEGLTSMTGPNDETYVRQLNRDNTRTIDRSGGTILHTSRTNPQRVVASKLPRHLSEEKLKRYAFDGKSYDLTPLVLDNLEQLGIDCLVVIGGDDVAGGIPASTSPKALIASRNPFHGTSGNSFFVKNLKVCSTPSGCWANA